MIDSIGPYEHALQVAPMNHMTVADVTFDADGLDPVYAPGTGIPEVGGQRLRNQPSPNRQAG